MIDFLARLFGFGQKRSLLETVSDQERNPSFIVSTLTTTVKESCSCCEKSEVAEKKRPKRKRKEKALDSGPSSSIDPNGDR